VIKESPVASGHHWYQEAHLLIDTVMVPVDSIASLTQGKIDLLLSLADIRHLPPYLSYENLGSSPFNIFLQVDTESWATASISETAARPPDELEVRKDENILLEDLSDIIGQVHDLIFDGGKLVAVAVRPGLFKREVLIQCRFLHRSEHGALVARISKKDVEQLQPFQPQS
jgi:hypothetical protein